MEMTAEEDSCMNALCGLWKKCEGAVSTPSKALGRRCNKTTSPWRDSSAMTYVWDSWGTRQGKKRTRGQMLVGHE